MDPLLTLKQVPRYYSGFNLLQIALVAAYSVIAFFGLKDYIHFDAANFLIGIAVMPLMLRQAGGQGSARFGWLALAFGLLGLWIPVKTALYMTLCCALLFLFESYKGRCTALPLLTLFFMSPVCDYFAHVFSFPVRLWLTRVAAGLLQVAGMPVQTAGNMISDKGSEFSVDPACMGLSMLVTSLLCGLILFAFHQRKYKLKLAVGWVLAGLAVIILLNIMANLCRIVLLVRFRLMPESPMHGLCGIACLVAYVLLPAAWLCRLLVRKKGKVLSSDPATGKGSGQGLALHGILLCVVSLIVLRGQVGPALPPQQSLPVAPGYTFSWLNKEVIKMENEKVLVYLKPLKGAVYTDHNPLLCWNGSGYIFEQIREQRWPGITLFTGTLCKGAERLYTAWWYENGSTSTISQWTWRRETLSGASPFTLVNVTVADEAVLQAEVARILTMKQQLVGRHK